jgi:hypothetical protein
MNSPVEWDLREDDNAASQTLRALQRCNVWAEGDIRGKTAQNSDSPLKMALTCACGRAGWWFSGRAHTDISMLEASMFDHRLAVPADLPDLQCLMTAAI